MHGRVVLVTVAVVLALSPPPVRVLGVESVGGGHRSGRYIPMCDHVKINRGLLTATALGVDALALGETGHNPRIDTGLADCYRSRRQRVRSPARRGGWSDRLRSHDPPSRSRDHSQSCDRRPSSSDHSQSGEKGRRDQQEGGKTVAVSQAPAVSEAPAGVTPVEGGASLSALPSAVQDLARFFLNLAGSSSLGAVGGVAGVAASVAGSGVPLCPSTAAGGAVTLGAATAIPAGVGVSPAAFAAVPGVSGLQQRQEDSRSRRRCSRSSSDGTDRCVKKRPRRRSPSPGPSFRRRKRHYRASSSSSGED